MKKSTYNLIVTLLALVIVIGGGVLLYQNLAGQVELDSEIPSTSNPSAETVPDFTMMDSSEGTWQLSDFRGKPVILNFWSSGCGPCLSEMPLFQSAWEEYGDQIEFVIVNLTDGYYDTFASAMGVVEENGYTMPIYFDTTGEGALAYSIRSIPMTFFIDENGVLVSQRLGALTEQTLEDAMEALLAD